MFLDFPLFTAGSVSERADRVLSSCSRFQIVNNNAHLLCLQELQAQLTERADQYHRLLDQGESMLLARGGEEAGLGATQTQQNLAMLQNKWASLNTKMEDRRVRQREKRSLLLVSMMVRC